jgi:hypothetical protein
MGGSGASLGSGGGVGSGGGPVSACPEFDGEPLPPGITHVLDTDIFGADLAGVADGQVYYVDFDDEQVLKRMPVAGGAGTVVGPIGSNAPYLRGNDLILWWERPGSTGPYRLLSAPLSDLTATKVLADDVMNGEALQADATHAYYATRAPSNVYRVPLAGGVPPEVLVAGGSPLGSILHQGFYFWLDVSSRGLERLPVGGGTRERLTEVFFGGPMAAEGTTIFWGDTSLMTVEKWSQGGGRVKLTSGDPTSMVAADGVLYWLNGFINGSLRSVKADGTDAKTLLCGLDSPGLVFLDGEYLVLSAAPGILRVKR